MSKGMDIVMALLKENKGNASMEQLANAIDIALEDKRIFVLRQIKNLAEVARKTNRGEEIAANEDEDDDLSNYKRGAAEALETLELMIEDMINSPELPLSEPAKTVETGLPWSSPASNPFTVKPPT
jgi:hypothetical protein